jgi:hypothetical protein
MKIQELAQIEGKENLRFMVPMPKIERSYNFHNLFTVNSYSHKKTVLEECAITEDPKETRFKLEENYKVTLKSLKDGRTEHFYIMDLENLIHKDYIKVDVKPAFLN